LYIPVSHPYRCETIPRPFHLHVPAFPKRNKKLEEFKYWTLNLDKRNINDNWANLIRKETRHEKKKENWAETRHEKEERKMFHDPHALACLPLVGKPRRQGVRAAFSSDARVLGTLLAHAR
jgi:hypothetical protein